MKRLLIGLLIGSLAIESLASELGTQKNTLYPPQSSVIVQEEFISGGTTSGTVGTLGFGVVASAVTGQPGIANRPGIMRIDTGAVSGTVARLVLYPASASAISPSVPQEVLWITRLNNNDANTTVRIGSFAGVGANPPDDGIYIEKLDADTNWFCITRIATVQTRTDSSVAVTTNFTKLFYRRNSTGVTFSIDGVDVCGTHTTNIPTVQTDPAVQIVNSAAAAKTLDMDYFQMKYTGITR